MSFPWSFLKTVILIFVFSGVWSRACSQFAELVDPFIGTTTAAVSTRWGGEGGTYPGAVVPWGFVQLTPETRSGAAAGYNYDDRSIFYFTCINHASGYPNGSSGNIRIMPVATHACSFCAGTYSRVFIHEDETASPGYYRVKFSDDGTTVETTATARTGFFRFTFPSGVTPQIYIGDAGLISGGSGKYTGDRFNAVFHFNQDVISSYPATDGSVFTFRTVPGKPQVIMLKVSASGTDSLGAMRNLEVELPGWNFDLVRQKAFTAWNKRLSVIDVQDPSFRGKRIFYSALYHSLLVPWVISDIDGNYRGRDGQIHHAGGNEEFGFFSPWDTFRSLHPLLTFLFPDVQRAMLRSMLDVFDQTGRLPADPMTGNHAIPVLADSYLKGIHYAAPEKIWQAMKQTLDQFSLNEPDFKAYLSKGYVPASFPESVTRTVEYAYDDWVMSLFAGEVMKDKKDSASYFRRGTGYQNLVDLKSLFLVPRKDSVFYHDPGTFGYKEGDKHIYSYFVPQQSEDLINRLGGDDFFTARLDSALKNGTVSFDNETVLHLPWLFNFAGYPDKTQYWLNRIMTNNYTDRPGGLPGNDDLGSMSSWYVFSAMGFYPACPGKTSYSIGPPLFHEFKIHLSDNKTLAVKCTRRNPADFYIRSVALNGKDLKYPVVYHADLIKGGELSFVLGDSSVNNFARDDFFSPDFSLSGPSVSKDTVLSGEKFTVRFNIENKGQPGTRIVSLFADSVLLKTKNCFVPENSSVTDSITCQLFRPGNVTLAIGARESCLIYVGIPEEGLPIPFEIEDVITSPALRDGRPVHYSYKIRNTGWREHNFDVAIKLNGQEVRTDKIRLVPGEKETVSGRVSDPGPDVNVLEVGPVVSRFKVYDSNLGSALFDLWVPGTQGRTIPDLSGLGIEGYWEGDSPDDGAFMLSDRRFITMPEKIPVPGDSLAMVVWVYPSLKNGGSADLFTQGDFNVLQIQENKYINFFAGGWGRGECRARVPDGWTDGWHMVAGVCSGDSLKLYIDGKLESKTRLSVPGSLRSSATWMIGRNEEFPGERIFHGQVRRASLFVSSLTDEEVFQLYRQGIDMKEGFLPVK